RVAERGLDPSGRSTRDRGQVGRTRRGTLRLKPQPGAGRARTRDPPSGVARVTQRPPELEQERAHGPAAQARLDPVAVGSAGGTLAQCLALLKESRTDRLRADLEMGPQETA